MSALLRGVCSVCLSVVPVRRNGTAREHASHYARGGRKCSGSGALTVGTRPNHVDGCICGTCESWRLATSQNANRTSPAGQT